jgi:hypothetical protein
MSGLAVVARVAVLAMLWVAAFVAEGLITGKFDSHAALVATLFVCGPLAGVGLGTLIRRARRG